MADPASSLVSGPLEGFAEGFLVELAGLGYAARSSEAQLRLLGHLSGWLAAEGLTAGDLNTEVVDRFVAARRRATTKFRSPRALVPLLAYLRRCGVAPAAAVVPPVELADVLLGRFAGYLSIERGLAAATVRSYLPRTKSGSGK